MSDSISKSAHNKLRKLRSGSELTDLPTDLNDFFKHTNFGATKSLATNSLYGFNNTGTLTIPEQDKTSRGMVFFTRPQLNMLTENLVHERMLYPLLTKHSMSIGHFIRNTLDPRLEVGYDPYSPTLTPSPNHSIYTPLVDNEQAFIPMLSNSLLNLSGFPDIEVPVYTSVENMYKGSYVQVDGVDNLNTTLDITAEFKSSVGNPVMNLLRIWSLFPSFYLHKKLMPYPDYRLGGTKDYETRVFRIALDYTDTYVEYIAATGPAIWTATGFGSILDYSAEEKYANVNKAHNYRLTAQGISVMDPILMKEFNTTVEYFNEAMKDGIREKEMIQVPKDLYNVFNYRGYPYINLRTNEFGWYVPKAYFNSVVENMPDIPLNNNYEV